jgi:hypothetical protein
LGRSRPAEPEAGQLGGCVDSPQSRITLIRGVRRPVVRAPRHDRDQCRAQVEPLLDPPSLLRREDAGRIRRIRVPRVFARPELVMAERPNMVNPLGSACGAPDLRNLPLGRRCDSRSGNSGGFEVSARPRRSTGNQSSSSQQATMTESVESQHARPGGRYLARDSAAKRNIRRSSA